MAHESIALIDQWTIDNPMNLIGCITFWLYIILALVFTTSILQALYFHQSAPQDAHRHRADIIFTTLAGLSFACLSFHMLHFLIQSYQDWRQTRLRLGIDSTEVDWTPGAFTHSVLEWSQTSTLFQDFGVEIARTNARFTWTLAALWMTFVVVFNLASQVAMGRLPQLWAFVGLSQILPISFTQNLLYVSRLRDSNTSSPTWSRDAFEVGVLFAAAIYAVCPFIVPGSVDSPNLMWLIAFIRSLLFVPPVLALLIGRKKPLHRESAVAKPQVKAIVTALGLVCSITHLYLALQDSSMNEIWAALFANPAVSALGFDFIISAFSALCWQFVGIKDRD